MEKGWTSSLLVFLICHLWWQVFFCVDQLNTHRGCPRQVAQRSHCELTCIVNTHKVCPLSSSPALTSELVKIVTRLRVWTLKCSLFTRELVLLFLSLGGWIFYAFFFTLLNLREADWFDIFRYTRYISLCEKIFTESLILAQDERWRHA